MLVIRPARLDDEVDLLRIDRATTSTKSAIVPLDPPRPAFFTETSRPQDVLVAELDGAVAGYLRLVHPTPFPASRHVLQITGFGVDPARQRRGVGRALLDAALAHARERGMRKVTLRVLATNPGARAAYAAAGFVVEGVLKREFHLDGQDVDDVLMAYMIA